ncbi:MAG: phosphatase PAP2 family protein [Spirochaetales bacterium]|nr:phosphatase PAP2 family protein [Spirochaetales bacterium]
MANDLSPYRKRVSGLRWGILISILLFAVFAVFTWCVTWYDMQPIGINGAYVGFGTINKAFHDMFPGDAGCYNATEVMGQFCILVAACNALLALGNLIHSRGFRRMGKRYLITMFYYAVIVALYIAFSLIPINSRPNNYEQSYPSSHTLVGLCVLYSEIVLLGYGAKRNRDWIVIFDIALSILMTAMVVFRLLSGVHWFTDIVGGVLLSLALMCIYRTLVRYFDHP